MCKCVSSVFLVTSVFRLSRVVHTRVALSNNTLEGPAAVVKLMENSWDLLGRWSQALHVYVQESTCLGIHVLCCVPVFRDPRVVLCTCV
jgi:hypothetical protein